MTDMDPVNGASLGSTGWRPTGQPDSDGDHCQRPLKHRCGAREAPVMGYAGRRIHLVPRCLRSPVSRAPFLDVDHVLDHLATMPSGSDTTANHAVFARDRGALLAGITGAHAVFLSAGGGLLAYQYGSPRRWHVVHAESGAPIDFVSGEGLPRPRWARLARGVGLDFSQRAVRAYVTALEGLADPQGRQVDWTCTAGDLVAQLALWQDYDEYGELTTAGADNRFAGLSGLRLAATLYAVTAGADLLQEAASVPFRQAIDTVTGPPDQLTVRGRRGRPVADFLRHLGFAYNHGRRRARRDRDWRTTADMRDDRATGKVVSLARLLAFGGLPHQAVRLLHDRADAIAHADTRRQDGPHSGELRRAAQMIAELFSPVVLPIEQLRDVQVGQHLTEAAVGNAAHERPARVWRVSRAAHHIWIDDTGATSYDLDVREETSNLAGVVRVRPHSATVLRIDYDSRPCSDHLEPLAGEWAVLDPALDGQEINQGVVLRASNRAAAAFERDAVGHTTNDNLGAA